MSLSTRDTHNRGWSGKTESYSWSTQQKEWETWESSLTSTAISLPLIQNTLFYPKHPSNSLSSYHPTIPASLRPMWCLAWLTELSSYRDFPTCLLICCHQGMLLCWFPLKMLPQFFSTCWIKSKVPSPTDRLFVIWLMPYIDYRILCKYIFHPFFFFNKNPVPSIVLGILHLFSPRNVCYFTYLIVNSLILQMVQLILRQLKSLAQ